MGGYEHTKEFCNRMSMRFAGENNPMFGRIGSKSPVFGKQKTEEQIQKMIKSRWTEDKRVENSLRVSGQNNPMYGKQHLEDTKEKIRQASIGKKDSNEIKKKKSESKLGAKHFKSKMVFCIELNQYFGSTGEASRITGVQQSGISRCCNGKQEYAGAYPQTGEKLHWIYTDVTNNSFVA